MSAYGPLLDGTSLCIIKPDAVRRGDAPDIEAKVDEHAFAVLARVEARLSLAQSAHLYEASEPGPARTEDAVALMASGPLIALAVSKVDGVAALAELVGPSNACHCSASPTAARRELALFFPKIFARELAVALLTSPAEADRASDANALLVAAAHADFLAVRRVAGISLSAAQAEAYASHHARVHAAQLTAAPLTAIVFEKPFAVEGLQQLVDDERAMAAAAEGAARTDGDSRLLVSGSPSSALAEARILFGGGSLEPSLTFALIRPEAMNHADEILAYAEASGFTHVSVTLIQVSQADARALQLEEGADDAGSSDEYRLTSTPSLALAMSRPFAVSAWLSLMGPADPEAAAREAPHSLRAQYGLSEAQCGVTGAATDAEARSALLRFFPALLRPSCTLALITPDATSRLDEIVDFAASEGLTVTCSMHTTLSTETATAFLRIEADDAAPPPAAQLHPPGGAPMVSKRSAVEGLSPTPAAPAVGSFEAAVALLASGPSVVMQLAGHGAVERWSALLGPSDPRIARVRCPACLRARLGVDATRAVGYGSRSAEAAARQIRFFFPSAPLTPSSEPASRASHAQHVEAAIRPTLNAGLVALCHAKPPQPVVWLARWLIEHNPNR